MYMYNKHTPWMSNLCLSKPFWLQFFCHPWSSNLEGQLKTAQLERECAYQLDLLVLKSGCCIPTTHNFPRIFHTNPRKKLEQPHWMYWKFCLPKSWQFRHCHLSDWRYHRNRLAVSALAASGVPVHEPQFSVGLIQMRSWEPREWPCTRASLCTHKIHQRSRHM